MSTTETTRVLGGRYQVGELLGRGGMADVYEAVDTRLGRAVAVKILRPAMAARADVRRRFEDEARAAARLSHPHVVAVFDTGEDDGTPWIVMERLSGETLAQRMAQAGGPLEVDWTLEVMGQVLGALGAAHAAGLIHRDVKPGNILFSDEGHAKVADFGIAKSVEAVGDATTAGMLLGTPRYLAPERIEGRPSSASSDLYAAGVILYEALAGRQAFAGDTPVSVAYAVQHTSPEPLGSLRPDLPAPLVAVVEKAMHRDPAGRFHDAGELAGALSGSPVGSPVGSGAAKARDADAGGDADATVAIAGAAFAAGSPDPTVLAAAVPAAAVGPAAPAPAAPAPAWWSGLDRRFLWVAGAGVALLLVIALFSLRSKPSPSTTPAAAASQTTAQGQAQPPANPLAAELLAVAGRVDDPGHDGPAGPTAAAGLRGIADKVNTGQDAGADATKLAQDVAAWHDDGQLGDTAARITLAALAKVPGADVQGALAQSNGKKAKDKGRGQGDHQGEGGD
ncbi:MAG TPA: serine/threonine-protein kinase [Acidimicrobiales bacterium]|nr:serine/threonine-protein kinase [Acidimicrobiales bacterium]